MAFKDYLKLPITVKLDDESVAIGCITLIAIISLMVGCESKEMWTVVGMLGAGLVGVLKGRK